MFIILYNNFKIFLNYLATISDKNWHKNIYKYSKYISIALILLTYTGIMYINPMYVNIVHNFLMYYVCVILLIRFNPLINSNKSAIYTEFNRNVAFTAGLILLTTLVTKNIADLFIK